MPCGAATKCVTSFTNCPNNNVHYTKNPCIATDRLQCRDSLCSMLGMSIV